MRLLVGYFSFFEIPEKHVFSGYRSYFVKGNGVPELTPHSVRHKPTCDSQAPCKGESEHGT